MMLAAKGLLTDYSDHFGDLNPVGLVTFVASQVVETSSSASFARKIAQVISDAVPSADEPELLDREYQLDLFQWREGHIIASVANRFKRGLARATTRSRSSAPSRTMPSTRPAPTSTA